MAAFSPNFTIQQSADCKTLTFTDASNFDDNDEGYDYAYFTTKTIGVYDSNNTLIGTLITVVDNTSVTFSLDKDRYLHIVYTLQHNTDTPYIKIYNVPLSCNVDLKYGEEVCSSLECGCDSENNKILFNIVKTKLASNIFAQRGNGVLSQESLDLANSYANCLETSQDKKCNCSH
jgi:hypothetical protein